MWTVIAAFLKKHWSIIALVIILLLLTFSIKGYLSEKKTNQDLTTLSHFNDSLSNSKITTWKDVYNTEHQKVENLSVSEQALQTYADSVAKVLKIKGSDITAISQTVTTLDVNKKVKTDTLFKEVPCPPGDTIRVPSRVNLSYSDKWISITGSVGDTSSIHIHLSDTLKRTDYTKRLWLLGPLHYYSDFTNSNPYIDVVSYKGVEVSPSTKHWSVGPSATFGYPLSSFNLSKPALFVGLSVQYSLFKF